MSNDTKIAAAQATISLSVSLVTVASVMLTIGAASATFAATTYRPTTPFWLCFFCSMIGFGASIIFSGRGTTEIRNALLENGYHSTVGKRNFNFQALSCFVAIPLFFAAFLMVGENPDSQLAEELVKITRELKSMEGAVRELQWSLGTLRQR